MHSTRFPGETPEYRAARDRLLAAERDLREHVERVAALRRALPVGGAVPEDYVFEEGDANLEDPGSARPVRMSDLFAPGKQTLVLYSFMYGPAAADACRMCTCFLDGLNGNTAHVVRRANLAVVARSPLRRVREFARSRGWTNLRMLSSAANDFNARYHAETSTGAQKSIIHVFVKRDGTIHHFYSSELGMIAADPGQDPRHIDLMWPLWNVLDLTPEGRGADWRPALNYSD
jgi:predicted dithiol-disulfide oxidoreductase (DUF899 family)